MKCTALFVLSALMSSGHAMRLGQQAKITATMHAHDHTKEDAKDPTGTASSQLFNTANSAVAAEALVANSLNSVVANNTAAAKAFSYLGNQLTASQQQLAQAVKNNQAAVAPEQAGLSAL